MLALLFRNASLLPGIKLGVIVRDSCDSPTFAAQQIVDFLQVEEDEQEEEIYSKTVLLQIK
jgi:hypothetical protein